MQKQKTHYSKHWVDIPAQIRVLQSRGLAIGDLQSAAEFLSYINYYRFTGYCLRFQTSFDANGNRLFAQGTTFEDVRDLCVMDKTLRDVFADGLEMIEISIKAATSRTSRINTLNIPICRSGWLARSPPLAPYRDSMTTCSKAK